MTVSLLRGPQILDAIGGSTESLQIASVKLVRSMQKKLAEEADLGNEKAILDLQRRIRRRFDEVIVLINHDQFFGIVVDGKLASMGGYDCVNDPKTQDDIYELQRLVTMDGFEGKGHGRKIFDTLHETVRDISEIAPIILYTEQPAVKKNAGRNGYGPISTRQYQQMSPKVHDGSAEDIEYAKEDDKTQATVARGEWPADKTYWQAYLNDPTS